MNNTYQIFIVQFVIFVQYLIQFSLLFVFQFVLYLLECTSYILLVLLDFRIVIVLIVFQIGIQKTINILIEDDEQEIWITPINMYICIYIYIFILWWIDKHIIVLLYLKDGLG